MAAQIAQILFPVNVPEPFDYAVPPGVRVRAGDFVFAPIGKQMKLGVVMAMGVDDGARTLKELAQVKQTKPLPPAMLGFITRTADYNCVSPGLVLRMVMRSHKADCGARRGGSRRRARYGQCWGVISPEPARGRTL